MLGKLQKENWEKKLKRFSALDTEVNWKSGMWSPPKIAKSASENYNKTLNIRTVQNEYKW